VIEFREALLDPICLAERLSNVAVEDASSIEMDARIFQWGLRLQNVEFAASLTFRGCRFEQEVVIVGCELAAGIDFSGAQFMSRLLIVGGRLGTERPIRTEISRATEEAGGAAPPAARAAPVHDRPTLVLEFARFGSDVEIAGATVFGAVYARACRIEGDLRTTSTVFSGMGDRALLNLAHARVNGRVALHDRTPSLAVEKEINSWPPGAGARPHLGKPTTFTSTLNSAVLIKLRVARVRGAVAFDRIKCRGSIDCSDGRFGSLSIWLSAINGDVMLTAIRAGAINIRRSVILGDMMLTAVRLGRLEILGLKLRGTLGMMSGVSGRINIDSHFDRHRTKKTEVDAIVCSGWNCTDSARIGLGRLGYDSQRTPALGVRGVRISNCRIAGDLEFLSGMNALREFGVTRAELKENDVRRLDCNPYLQKLVTNDPIVVNGSAIGGHLDLTNVHTADLFDLSDSTVAKSIRFASPLSARAAKAGKDEVCKALILLACAIRNTHLKPDYQELMTSKARRVNLERTTAGSIDLTGLRLVGTGAKDASVLASHVTVSRELQTARRVTPKEQTHFAQGLDKLTEQCRTNPVIFHLLDSTLRLCLVPVALPPCTPSERLFAYLKNVAARAPAATNAPDQPSASATIPGSLQLNNARVGLLRLSHESFSRVTSGAAGGGAAQQTVLQLDDADPAVALGDNPRFPAAQRYPGGPAELVS
jgi:hypothetical protein